MKGACHLLTHGSYSVSVYVGCHLRMERRRRCYIMELCLPSFLVAQNMAKTGACQRSLVVVAFDFDNLRRLVPSPPRIPGSLENTLFHALSGAAELLFSGIPIADDAAKGLHGLFVIRDDILDVVMRVPAPCGMDLNTHGYHFFVQENHGPQDGSGLVCDGDSL